MIYFAQAVGLGTIKIGYSLRVGTRLKQLVEQSGDDLRLLAVMNGDLIRERTLHNRFNHLRVRPDQRCEWFQPEQNLLDFIAKNGRPWDESDDAPKPIAVLINAKVCERASIAASMMGLSLPVYISNLVAAQAERDISREAKKIVESAEKPARPKGTK